VSVTSTSADANYEGLRRDVAGSVTDDDVAGVLVTAGELSLSEASTDTVSYTVVLESQPLSDVSVAAAVSDGQATVSPIPAVFTAANWNVPQTITVSVVDDGDVESSPHATDITHTVTSADPAYPGDVSFLVDGASARTVTIAIDDNESTTEVSVAPAAPNDGVATVVTAVVTGGPSTPTGTVQFAIDGVSIGEPVTLTSGAAWLNLGTLERGTYAVSAHYSGDDAHAASSANAGLTVTSTPIAGADSLSIDENSGAVSLDVLANDTDADGDPLTITANEPAAHGSVSCTSTSCEYTPDANYSGEDSFRYTVSDGRLTASATVTVVIAAVNEAPTLAPLSVQVAPKQPATFNVLAGATDVDGDALRLVGYSEPAHGVVTCTSAGECTYKPDAKYSGSDTFEYTVSDGTTDVTGSVAITVTARSKGGPRPK
jgi:hypothetical protein